METSRKQTTAFETKIIEQLEALPVRVSIFTEFEDKMIRKFYPSKGAKIGDVFGKSRAQIRRRARALKVLCEKLH